MTWKILFAFPVSSPGSHEMYIRELRFRRNGHAKMLSLLFVRANISATVN
jgi:hypothetical protein